MDVSDVSLIYNFPISNNISVDQLIEQTEEILHDSQQAFKINIS